MVDLQSLLQPFTIKQTVFRNRLMSTGHAPSYGENGNPTERYQLYHEEKARGGIALTMFGGSSSVAIDSPARPWNQIDLSRDGVIPHLAEFSARIHRHGTRLMCQMTHMGRRARWDVGDWLPVICRAGHYPQASVGIGRPGPGRPHGRGSEAGARRAEHAFLARRAYAGPVRQRGRRRAYRAGVALVLGRDGLALWSAARARIQRGRSYVGRPQNLRERTRQVLGTCINRSSTPFG
jgi:hypothetical protein